MPTSAPPRISPLRSKTASCNPRSGGAVLVDIVFSSCCGRRMRTPGCARLEARCAATARIENKIVRALFIEFRNPVAVRRVFGFLVDAIWIELEEADRARVERDRTEVAAHSGDFAGAPFLKEEANRLAARK